MVRVRDRRSAYRILVGDLMEGDNLEDLGLDGRIILRWIFEKLGGMGRIGMDQYG